jgi:hypothetical protein
MPRAAGAEHGCFCYEVGPHLLAHRDPAKVIGTRVKCLDLAFVAARHAMVVHCRVVGSIQAS